MDLWKMRLRAASFRGVPFGVTADESEGGRRTVTHEFPQRETYILSAARSSVNAAGSR